MVQTMTRRSAEAKLRRGSAPAATPTTADRRGRIQPVIVMLRQLQKSPSGADHPFEGGMVSYGHLRRPIRTADKATNDVTGNDAQAGNHDWLTLCEIAE